MEATEIEHTATGHSAELLHAWVTGRIAHYLEIPAGSISGDVPLAEYGLDSVNALTVASEIEDHLSLSLDASVMWDYPAVDDLVVFLMQEMSAGAVATEVSQ
jgi:acyl carrier protein